MFRKNYTRQNIRGLEHCYILFVNKCSYKFKLFQPINNLIFNILSIMFVFFLSKVFIDVQKHLFHLKQLGTSTCFIRSAGSCE